MPRPQSTNSLVFGVFQFPGSIRFAAKADTGERSPRGTMGPMGFFRRSPPPPKKAGVEVWNDEDGLLVTGEAAAVEQVVTMLTSFRQPDAEPVAMPELSAAAATGALAVYATGFADGATSGQYIRHTPRARQLMADHGVIPNGTGGFRAIVHDGQHIAGQLDWEVASMGPERALAFQSAAIGMALRTAIKDVEAAIERVEDKVDRIVGMIRVGRIGDVLGTRRTLQPLVEKLASTGRVSPVDWSTVAALGPAINIDIETLRAQVRFLLSDRSEGNGPRARAAGVEALLSDGLLAETLALLVVAEHNESLWARLRLAEIDRSDPDHLSPEFDGVTTSLRSHHDLDQELLDELVAAGVDLLTPAPLDGFAVMPARRLKNAEADFTELAEWFADQRHLDDPALVSHDRPRLLDSGRHVARQARGVVGSTSRMLDPRKTPRPQPEIPETTDPAPEEIDHLAT